MQDFNKRQATLLAYPPTLNQYDGRKVNSYSLVSLSYMLNASQGTTDQ